ncbi:vacuolar fusion protein ccz1 like protein a [Quercus suber]|uniref:Vacuolar fusion protein ccz1 like protein a n=1 Tax=Quercus suber TaxID=58331 RepID=A0AAW0IXN7_QUESU
MGMSAATTAAEGIKFCIFDLRRGQQEGQELDKILFFFPADLPFSAQLSVIGLSEGLITFTRIFSPGAACEVVEKNESEAIWRIDALRKVLKEVHSLFLMFHGSIRTLIEKEPAGGLIRSHLYPFIMDYLSDFLLGKKLQLPSFRDCLKERGTVQMLTVSREAAIEVQSLVRMLESFAGNTQFYTLILFQDLLVSTTLSPADFLLGKKLQLPSFRDCLKERGTVQMLTVSREAAIEVQSLVRMLESFAGNTQFYTLILFQDLLVSTTLSPVDTINLFTYAVLRLTPRALSSGVSSWSYLRKGSTASNVATGSILAQSASVSEQTFRSPDTSPPGGDNSHHIARPLQPDRWSKGKDGFLVTDIWGTEASSSISATPTIWLQQTEERVYVCAYQYRSLTLILLVPVASILNGEQGVSVVKQQILENASLKMLKIEEKLSKGWAGENAYHVSGYRYLLVDGDRDVSRASPPGKVTTLTKESLLALSKVREEVDLEKGRMEHDNAGQEKDLEVCIRAKNNAWESLLALSKVREEVDLEKGRMEHDNAGQEKDLEVCIRAKNNAWVIARITKGKELYMVLEKANETVLYASDAVEKFSNRYCNGAFSLD